MKMTYNINESHLIADSSPVELSMLSDLRVDYRLICGSSNHVVVTDISDVVQMLQENEV